MDSLKFIQWDHKIDSSRSVDSLPYNGALGYSVGFIGRILVLPSFLQHFAVDTLSSQDLAAAQSFIVSVWLLGALIGVPLGMPVCSIFGNKRCLQFSAVLYVLGSVLHLVDVNKGLVMFEAGGF